MFTGIVEEIGTVRSLERLSDTSARITIDCQHVLAGTEVGDSIAVDGCCLTVTAMDSGFQADLMAETLRATSLGGLALGGRVNLERAVAAGERFGGHLVQGHVDAVGTVTGRREQPGTVSLVVTAPAAVARYLVPKGSVTVSGVSLTVVEVDDGPDGDASFTVGLVPHTLEVTTLGECQVGDRVNLEADVIAKYAERILRGGADTPYRRGS